MISIFNTPILSLCNKPLTKRIVDNCHYFVHNATINAIKVFCKESNIMYAESGNLRYQKFADADNATQTDICKQIYAVAFRFLEYTEPLSRKVKYMPEKRYNLVMFETTNK